MLTKRHFHTDQFTRGGQIFTHEWVMRLQNFKTVLQLSLIFALSGLVLGSWAYGLGWWNWNSFFIQAYLFGKVKVWLWEFIQALGFKPGFTPTTTIPVPGKGMVKLYTEEFLEHPWTHYHLTPILNCFLWSVSAWVAGVVGLYAVFKKKSKALEEKQITRGRTIQPPQKVMKQVLKQGKPTFYITPELGIPKNTENQHMAIIGATRMGKTNFLITLLTQMRHVRDRAIILDSTGELTAFFYRPGIDKLLNPLDSRTEPWDVWAEELEDYEYDAWASSMVPEGLGEPIWHETARALLSYTALKLSRQKQKTMLNILEWSCWNPLETEVCEFYHHSPVSSIMNSEAEKTASGVRMNLSKAINAFRYLTPQQDKPPFSITKWVADKQTDQWLFLTCLPNQRSALAGMLSSWFNFTFLGLERAGLDFRNRLWMICDELPGLDYPISSLKRLVAEGAKYGACCSLGFQNNSQIDKLYGSPVTKTLMSNCSTRIIFRSPDEQTAKSLSAALGEQEVIHSLESFSIGAHRLRDGVNLSSQQLHQAVITPTEIMSLNQLEAFVNLPGNLPTTKVTFKLTQAFPLQPSFVPTPKKESTYAQE